MYQKSIAILPFLNMSSDPENEYFSDGITEEIINALTTIKGLKVASRTSSFAYKNRKADVRHIGNQLGVAAILEGSIRKANNWVRITAQLIRTDNGFHIWSGKFDRELIDIFELQDEISLEIAEQVRENFGHLNIEKKLVDAPTDNIEAYNLYLKARFHHLKWDSEGIRKAIELYSQCIEMAPRFSWPYFGAAYCHSMYGSWTTNVESLQLAEEYIDKGFGLNDQSSLGFYSKATLCFWGKWDVIRGEEFYRKSISINPSYTEAIEGLAELYTAVGDFEQAMKYAKTILSLDPLSPNHHFTKANIHYLSGESAEAIKCLNTALEINPLFTHAIGLMQLCLIQLKRGEDLEEFLNNNSLAESPSICRKLYHYKYLDSDKSKKSTSSDFTKTEQDREGELFPWQLFLLVHTGHFDMALDHLEHAVENKRGQFINFINTPLLDPIHENDRFKRLANETFAPVRYHDVDDKPASDISKNLMNKREIEQTHASLQRAMNDEKMFLISDLSLRSLAEAMNLHPNKLSWFLNDRVGLNFNDYINSYRLSTFQEKALDPANTNYTLLGLAFDSGFNSKSAFNDYFKKKTGTTPRSWLKRNQ